MPAPLCRDTRRSAKGKKAIAVPLNEDALTVNQATNWEA